MDEPAKHLLDILRDESSVTVEHTVSSFLAAYWKLSDRQVDWCHPVGKALNELAEKLEYFVVTEAQPFNGAVTPERARILIGNVLFAANEAGL
ncbi:hypothetical protein [Stutzerimonas stutzeri]|jgi:hypothetical protein|uniref:hypothetical protein n=1 Tax=Stutzerimonas stutzeri TaxID=316 RepID=UPI001249C90F|nr:hypothetical protein [Stutzerimonas stutzeri]MDH0084947.1 hypothetical protein [Stutzerimonas stutzeri]WBL60274.1 hypothetical protein LQF05_20515 [Stutzerimonas stutzeri]